MPQQCSPFPCYAWSQTKGLHLFWLEKFHRKGDFDKIVFCGFVVAVALQTPAFVVEPMIFVKAWHWPVHLGGVETHLGAVQAPTHPSAPLPWLPMAQAPAGVNFSIMIPSGPGELEMCSALLWGRGRAVVSPEPAAETRGAALPQVLAVTMAAGAK